MFNYLNNPSAAIRKRLFLIGLGGENGKDIDSQIFKMKAIDKCFSIVDKMTYENALFHGYDSLGNCVKVFSEF